MKIYSGIYQHNVELNVSKGNYNENKPKQILETTPRSSVSHFICKQMYSHLLLIDLEDEQMSIFFHEGN